MQRDLPKGVAGDKLAHNRRTREFSYQRNCNRLHSRQTLGHNLLNKLIEWWPLADPSNGDGYAMGVHNAKNLGTNISGHGTGVLSSYAVNLVNGSNRLTRASEAALQLGSGVDMTICAWINLSSVPPPNSALAGVIVSKDTAAAGGREYTFTYVTTPGNIRFQIFDGTSSVGVVNPTWTPTAGTWYFAMARCDTSVPQLSMSVNNGALVSATGAITGTPATTTTTFSIGSDSRASNTAGFDGKIQRVGIWKRVLTASEEAYLYNNGVGRDYPFI